MRLKRAYARGFLGPRPVGYIVGVMGIRIEVCYFEDAAAVRYGSWCERTQVEVINENR